MHYRWTTPVQHQRRRGSLTPALVVSFTVLLGVLALAVDWAYMNIAHVELARAADAAALAAARALVHDHELKRTCDPHEHRREAIEAARRFAGFNFTGCDPTELRGEPDELGDCDIHVGRLVRIPGQIGQFDADFPGMPDTVQVTARRTASRNNPVGLLLGSVLGVCTADVVASSQASLDDQIVGFKPVCGVPIPLVPWAILSSDPHCRRLDTWEEAIIKRRGSDRFGMDDECCEVVRRGDGLTELELTFGHEVKEGAEHDQPNVVGVQLCHRFDDRTMMRQTRLGIEPNDLEQRGGVIELGPNGTLSLPGRFQTPANLAAAMSAIRGQCRIWPLFAAHAETNSGRDLNVTVVGFVGARVMEVRATDHGCFVVRIQACMVVTRAAIADPRCDVPRNKYIRKISITG